MGKKMGKNGERGLPLFETGRIIKKSLVWPHIIIIIKSFLYTFVPGGVLYTEHLWTIRGQKRRRGEDGGTKEENRRLLRPRFLGRFDDV